MISRYVALFCLCIAFCSAAGTTSNPAPDLAKNPAPEVTPLNPALPTIFIAGDSTAARGKGETQQGWGVPFADYFDPTKVNVANRARGGRSNRTFITGGEWAGIVSDLKAGDLVLIQFGHNDGGAINDEPPPPLRARGSLPGLGEETKEIDNVVTKQHEVVHTFGWYIRKMISEVQAKGATPVLLGLTVRNRWQDGRIERGPGRYNGWMHQLALDHNLAFADVSNAVADQLEALGQARTADLYPQDHTHFSAQGADVHARAVVAALKGMRPRDAKGATKPQGDPSGPIPGFHDRLSTKGREVETDSSAWLRLPVPADPALPTLFLAGDSTVRNGGGDGSNGEWGWGEFLAPHLNLERINLVNRAVGGTGVETFRAIGYWRRLISMVKPGDIVLMQWGHNDNPPRGPARGIGDQVEDLPDPKTKQPRPMHSWGWYLRQNIAEVRARGATPIVCSLVPRKKWADGKVARSNDSFALWARQVAEQEGVAFIDLNERVAQRYDALRAEAVNALFADEHTHTNAAGARLNAEVVAEELRKLPGNPLGTYLRP